MARYNRCCVQVAEDEAQDGADGGWASLVSDLASANEASECYPWGEMPRLRGDPLEGGHVGAEAAGEPLEPTGAVDPLSTSAKVPKLPWLLHGTRRDNLQLLWWIHFLLLEMRPTISSERLQPLCQQE